MKYIQKKSVVKKDPTLGGIFDTLNIENKEENTYSARIIKDIMILTELEDLSSEVTNKNASATSISVKVYKYGKLRFLSFTVERSGNWTDGTTFFTVPNTALPKAYTYFTGCGAGNTIKMFNLGSDGKVTIRGDINNTQWLSGQLLYLAI